MAIAVSNVNITTDTFPDWLTKTNEVCYKFSTYAVTANSTLSVTTGNACVNGVFSSNTIAIIDEIRGGNNTTANVLNITSNVSINNTVNRATGSVTFSNTSANQVVDSFSISASLTTKYLLQVNTVYGIQSTEILIMPDGGSNVYSTEYATLSTNGILGVFSANIASGNINLLMTPSINSTGVKFERTSLTP